MTEAEIINDYFRPLVRPIDAIDDDAAELDMPVGKRMIVTADALVEGAHFLPDDPLYDIGRKLVAVNVSDCLAMGATPYRALLILLWPHGRAMSAIGELAKGIGDALDERGCLLVGGDTSSIRGPLTVAMTMHGLCDKAPTHRSGAKPDDDIWMSGNLGDAHLGLLAAKGEDMPDMARLLAAFRTPEPPPNRIAAIIAAHAGAATDISDGLIADAGNMARAGGLTLNICCESLPFSDAARQIMRVGRCSPADLAAGGDDYQSLFTAPKSARDATKAAVAGDLQLTRIGFCTKSVGPARALLLDAGKEVKLAQTGFDHFRRRT